MQFRRDRQVANDRSDQDEAIDALHAQVGLVAEALDQVEAGILPSHLATRSDVTSVIAIDSFSLGAGQLVHWSVSLQRDWV